MPVWQSEAFSELKITANSTYWEAKVVFDRPYLSRREQNTAMEGGGFEIISGMNQEKRNKCNEGMNPGTISMFNIISL